MLIGCASIETANAGARY